MLLDDIKQFLEENSFSPIFSSNMPDEPDSCIVLYEYSGNPPEAIRGLHIERPMLQIKVRDKIYPRGRQMIQDLFELLHNRTKLEINGTKYQHILANQQPEPISIDSKGRIEFVVNFSIVLER